MFTLKSYYERLLRREEHSFPYRSIWVPKVPRKVCFFVWLAKRSDFDSGKFEEKEDHPC